MGQLIRFAITGGEVADITQAKALLVGSDATTVIADKGYDSDELVNFIREGEAAAVIPPRRTAVADAAMIGLRTGIAIASSASSAALSNFDVLPPATTNWLSATHPSSLLAPRLCG